MKSAQEKHDPGIQKVKCWPARLVGVFGLITIFWFGGYAVQDIPTDHKMIPLTILWGLMFIGGCVDVLMVGREGKGGLLILAAGVASYLFLLLWLLLGWERQGLVPAVMGSFPLLISGLLFYQCGRRRKKLKG